MCPVGAMASLASKKWRSSVNARNSQFIIVNQSFLLSPFSPAFVGIGIGPPGEFSSLAVKTSTPVSVTRSVCSRDRSAGITLKLASTEDARLPSLMRPKADRGTRAWK